MKSIQTIFVLAMLSLLTACGGGGGGGSASGGGATQFSAVGNTFTVSTVATGLTGIGGLGVDLSGNIYYLDIVNSEIKRISAGQSSFDWSCSVGNNSYALIVQSSTNNTIFYTTNQQFDVSNNPTLYINQIQANCSHQMQLGSVLLHTNPVANGVAYQNNYLYSYAVFSSDYQLIKIDSVGNLTEGVSVGSSEPGAITADNLGNLYVVEGCSIYKISQLTISTQNLFAGDPNGGCGHLDGIGSAARFNFPGGITVDQMGNLYVADTLNNTIRRITTAGVVSTVAGNGTASSSPGVNLNSSFSSPTAIAINAAGDTLYVTDNGSGMIRKIRITQ